MIKNAVNLILQGFKRGQRLWTQKCPFYVSKEIWKYGKRNGHQRYRCKACLKHFDGVAKINPSVLWKRYSEDKQTMQQLAEQYGCSRKTIARYLKKAQPKPLFPPPETVNLVIDTTYFKRGYGVMGAAWCREQTSTFCRRRWLWDQRPVSGSHSKSAEERYKNKKHNLRRGLNTLLAGIPMQMCYFHQVQIVNRYLTRNPKSSAARELRALVLNLKNSTQTSFKEALAIWHMQHQTFLNERSTHPHTMHTSAWEAPITAWHAILSGFLPLSITLNFASQKQRIYLKESLPTWRAGYGVIKGWKKARYGLQKIIFIKNDFFSPILSLTPKNTMFLPPHSACRGKKTPTP